MRPNKNCNLTTWVSGCEPGWAFRVGQNQQVNVKNSQNIPTRTHDFQACCEGFFCPRGILYQKGFNMTIYSQLTRKKRKKNYALSLCLPVLPYTTSINDVNVIKISKYVPGKGGSTLLL